MDIRIIEMIMIMTYSIDIAKCSVPILIRNPINKHEFASVDAIITSQIANYQIKTYDTHLVINASVIIERAAEIRSIIRNSLVSMNENHRINMLILCDIVDEWISNVSLYYCYGTLIRITRYIFEINDIYTIAISNEQNTQLLGSYMSESMNHMTLPVSITRDLDDRASALTNIIYILRNIDNHVLETLKASLNMIETCVEVAKLLRTINYIQISVDNLNLAVHIRCLTSYHLRCIWHNTNSLYFLYNITLMRNLLDTSLFSEIFNSDYMHIYMNRTKQLYYIKTIANRIIFELKFFCEEMLNSSYTIVTQEIAYLELLLDLICKFESQSSQESFDKILIFFNDGYKLCKDFLEIIKNSISVAEILLQMPKLNTEIENIIVSLYLEFGDTRNNIRLFFKSYKDNWESLINVPVESIDVYQLKIYCLLFSIAKKIPSYAATQCASQKYIFTTFLKLCTLRHETNETRVCDIILDLQHKIPQIYDLYLCSFIYFTNSLHEVEDVFKNYDASLLSAINTFFRTSIQQIYSIVVTMNFSYNLRYVSVSVVFLDIFRTPIIGDNTIRKLEIFLNRISHFYTKYFSRNDNDDEIPKSLYKGLIELKSNYGTEFKENMNLQFIILSINYVNYKILKNEMLKNKRNNENITTKEKSRTNTKKTPIIHAFNSISSAILNSKRQRKCNIDNLNKKIRKYIDKNLTSEIDGKYKITEAITTGCLMNTI